MKSIQVIVVGVILFAEYAFADPVTKDYTFGSGDPVSSSKINTNFDELFTEINLKETRLDNIEANAWVTEAKINDGAVTSAKLATGAAGAQSVDIDENDYLVWKLDETVGATTYVNSGTAASADLTATGSIRAGRVGMFGNALDFRGTAGVYAGGAAAANPDGDSITISLWIKPNSFPASTWSNIVGKKYVNDTSWNAPYVGMQLLMDGTPADGSWYVAWNIGGAYDAVSPTTASADKLIANVWSHIGATFDGTTMRLYKDGVEVGSKATSGIINFGSGPWLIGGNTPAYSQALSAMCDDVRVANTVRSVAWFRNVYAQGVQHGF